jgi:flagellin
MNVAIRNANDGISLAQTAEGAIGQISNILQRMRELAVQSANATNSADDRLNLNAEYKQLSDEIDRTLKGTTFNGLVILGANAGTLAFQVGANQGESVPITTKNLLAEKAITDVFTSAIDTDTGAKDALKILSDALDAANKERAAYGAINARFESIISTLAVAVENQAASRGRIVDADFAQETANLSRTQILQQAGTAMVAQANQLPQQVLSLLQR